MNIRIRYYHQSGIHHLREVRISKAQADQRKGRAGRTQKGVCYRLYPAEEYEHLMQKNQEAEMMRDNLSTALFYICAIGNVGVREFRFIEKPPQGAFTAALQLLHYLQVVDDADQLTEDIGKKVATSIPLSNSLPNPY